MKLAIINQEDSKAASSILAKYYADGLIPAEKKTYLTKLKDSVGPYMGVESASGETHYILDAASQIATLGHGFNAPTFFGTAQFLESWTNDSTTKEFKNARNAYVNFFARKLNWKKTHMTLVHSGAEANETALGYCYQKRVNPNANKVLAFEGSFHGRMMVTLSATWNKSKREPFEWQNYLTQYVPFPEINDSNINVKMPERWRQTWNYASLKEFATPKEWQEDEALKLETNILLTIREKLLSKTIFAILVEPMQCEGGERYSSDRFHTALLLLARTFKVPVIYDEVQTGYHLGREFFWHRQLNLKDLNGDQLNPDYVVCAKKAQLGIVLSHWPTKNVFKGEEFSVASFYRGYAHAIGLDQSQKLILELEEVINQRVEALLKKFPTQLTRPRVNGLAFAFDLPSSELMNKFVELRFKHGLLFYPAGDKTLRFRLNTSFKTKDLDFLFDRLEAITKELFTGIPEAIPTHVETDHISADINYRWHKLLIETKIQKAFNQKIENNEIFSKINELLNYNVKEKDLELIAINASNFSSFRQQIIDLEKRVYEPARQTDIQLFELTLADKHSICLGLINSKKELQGIAFAGPLKLYPLERGVRMDPNFNDPDSLYMLDVTIDPNQQKSGFGRSLKFALICMAITNGTKRIQGRNRDRLASAMLNINLSLGSIEQNYIKEDYPDFEDFRDVLYYTTKVDWKNHSHHLSRATTMPIGVHGLSAKYIESQMPTIVNKVCLSNFVSEAFLNAVKEISMVLPTDLRHVFTASGQSEACDKVCKTVWVKSSDEIKANNVNKMLTFKGHYFGQGSMLSRSLTLDQDPYFNVKKLDHPDEKNYTQILTQIEQELKTGEYLAVWLEPLLQKTMQRVPYEFLRQLKTLAKKYNVATIYNETASQLFRYTSKAFMPSSIEEVSPDAGFMYLSGQAALTFASSKYFLDKPLMMISTWDGDEYHFLSYFHAFKNVMNNLEDYLATQKKFQAKLIDELSRYEMDAIVIENGFGFFRGTIPASFNKFFTTHNNHTIVCASYDEMKEFL